MGIDETFEDGRRQDAATPVIPAQAGIREVFDNTGFRANPGMTRKVLISKS